MSEKQKWLYDIECYTNYFLVMFKHSKTNKILFCEEHNNELTGDFVDKMDLFNFIKSITLVGFNSMRYDNIMLASYIRGYKNNQLKIISDDIILGENSSKYWVISRKYDLDGLIQRFDSIDLYAILPMPASLKMYGTRLHAPKLQELPIDPSSLISVDQCEELKKYCINDLDTTQLLYESLIKQIEIREVLNEKYNADFRSKSDPQIAETIISKYLSDTVGRPSKRIQQLNPIDPEVVKEEVQPFKYKKPSWIKFESDSLNELLNVIESINFSVKDNGQIEMPEQLSKLTVIYSGMKYKVGIGGLHSQEKKQTVKPNDDQYFGEFDVASMYPSIIIEQGLYPKHLSIDFLTVYKNIKDTRIKAKRSGDKTLSDVYKIVLNGSYGKFGSIYSFLYAPELLIQTTITGQLALLMLIEKLTNCGGKVTSANTDGVNVLYDKTIKEKIFKAKESWENTTTYELEYTPYLAVYSRDVNNYIAITETNDIKRKGCFAIGGLSKNPSNNICIETVVKYLTENVDIESYIKSQTNINKFVTSRKVTGGAVFKGVDLGKTVRFYHSTKGDTIYYKKNNNKVAKSDGTKPLMDLPEKIPNDLDYNWYINETKNILEKDLRQKICVNHT